MSEGILQERKVLKKIQDLIRNKNYKISYEEPTPQQENIFDFKLIQNNSEYFLKFILLKTILKF